MELTMSSNDLNSLLNNIASQVSSLDKKQDEQNKTLTKILIQAEKTNGRVTSLEKGQGKKFSLPPNVIYLIAVGGVVALVIVATSMGINVKGIL